jgi:hypothetical protein
LGLEISQNLLFDVALGRGGKAGDWRNGDALFLGKLPDETAGIKVVRAKIVAPFGKAMGLVNTQQPISRWAMVL